MPQFTWHDGTLKYLHVDVHLLENYQVAIVHMFSCLSFSYIYTCELCLNKVQVGAHISQLRQRLNWLTSGSRVPFGVITEKR